MLYHVSTGFVVNSLGMYWNVLVRPGEIARGIARGISIVWGIAYNSYAQRMY